MIKLFKKIADFYSKNLKLKHKLIFSHLLLVLIPTVVVSVFFYESFYDLVVKSTVTSEQALAFQGGNAMGMMLETVEGVANTIIDYPASQALFAQDGRETKKAVLSDKDADDYYQSIVAAIHGNGNRIKDIKVYYDDFFDKLLYANVPGGRQVFLSINNIKTAYWYGIFSTKDIDFLYCPTMYLSYSEVRDNGDLAYIRRIPYKGDEEKTAAYIVVYFSGDKVEEALKKNVTMEKGASYIVNERSELVASSNDQWTGIYFMNPEKIHNEIKTENTFATDTFLGENVYIGYQKINSSDWYLVSAIPVNEVLKKGQSVILYFLLFYLAFVIVAFLMALLLSASVSKRLGLIINQMKKVRFGKPELIADAQVTKDEIGEVADTYNYMTRSINLLLEEQEKAAKEMQLAEFKALQAQINPHFLYNSLDMINWLTQSGRNEEATKAVQALSRFYKLTLSKKNAVGTVEMEMEHVSLYVELQNMRYGDSVELVIDIPNDVLENMVPRLTFQPIIENAIQHGIAMKPEKSGTIVITGWQEDESLVFFVSDDGVGIGEDQIKKILSGEGNSVKGSNIGIYNTHRRLQLLYGMEYGLKYESKPGAGTEVTVRIPLNKEGQVQS